jgi:hypothetical protein
MFSGRERFAKVMSFYFVLITFANQKSQFAKVMSALFCTHNLRKFLEILDDVELVFAKIAKIAKIFLW